MKFSSCIDPKKEWKTKTLMEIEITPEEKKYIGKGYKRRRIVNYLPQRHTVCHTDIKNQAGRTSSV